MFIKPMTPITDITSLQNTQGADKKQDINPFKNIFQDALDDVYATSKAVDDNAYDLVAGNTDDLHNLQIELSKAELSVSYMVQLRNKSLEAYNEMMRITV